MKALLLPDKRGWIFDFLCTHEAEALRNRGWHVDVVYQEDPFATPLPPDQYDLAFNPNYSPRPFERLFKGRLVRGIFGHKWAWTDHPRRALDRSLRNACAVVVPNRELLQMIRWYYPRTFRITEGTDPAIFRFERHNLHQPLTAAWTGDPRHTWKGLQEIVIPACEQASVPLKIGSTLTRTELNDLYNSVDVVLVATRNEGSPNCVFEAGACGRPVIGTRAGIIPEAIVDGRNGFIVERSIEAFVDKLLWCKEHQTRLHEMGLAHREVVLARYTVAEHTRQFCDLMELLLVQGDTVGPSIFRVAAGMHHGARRLARAVSHLRRSASAKDAWKETAE